MSCSFSGIRTLYDFSDRLAPLFANAWKKRLEAQGRLTVRFLLEIGRRHECLEQTEGRVYDLEGDDWIILARVRRLLCVASMDDWSLLKVLENNAAVLQLEAVVPTRNLLAFVGRYHKSQFETAVGDLGMLRAAWESAAEVSQKCNWRTCWTL